MGLVIGDFEIIADGDYATVTKIGQNKKTGDKTLTPVAYVRDLLGALAAVQRRMSVSALEKETNIKKLMTLLQKQHEELINLVKAGCVDCLETGPKQ